jgi:hypothetical protein
MWLKVMNGKVLGNSALAVAFSGLYSSSTGELNQLINYASMALIIVGLLLNTYRLFWIVIILSLISLLVVVSVALKASITSFEMVFLVALIFFSSRAVFFSYKIRQASYAKNRTY